MSQAYVDDCYASTHSTQTDMQNIENNFAALKSCFSGTAAPSNPIAGMWWYDTTANILKLRNEANNAWQSVWDFANNKPVIANLSNEITGAMISAAIKDAVAGTASLRTLGTGAQQACAGNDARLSDNRVPTNGSVTAAKLANAAVSQAKLKTSTGSVGSQSEHGDHNYILPGGGYGFYPRTKSTGGSVQIASGNIGLLSYRTNILFDAGEDYYTMYAQQRYVTSSGEVFWIFILRDKTTKEVKSMYQAPDHPCFGNGGKPLLVPHPFGSYDPETQEIIVINPSHEEVEAMKKMGERGEDEPDKDLLEVITEEYEIDENSNPAWPTIPVTVGLPKDYETKQMGEDVRPIKKVIPRPAGVLVRNLKRRK